MEDGNVTYHDSLSKDDESKFQSLQFPALPALQPQDNPYQELCGLMVQVGSKSSVQFCDHSMRTLENIKVVFLHFIEQFSFLNTRLETGEKHLEPCLKDHVFERKETFPVPAV